MMLPSTGNRGNSNISILMQDIGDWWTLFILVLLVIIFSVTSPGFFSTQNFVSTTVSASNTIILAVAETFVIITGGIDLSVGAILGLSGMVGADVMQSLMGHGDMVALWSGLLAGLLTGVVFGAINGLVVTVLEVTPFIATLGMLGIATGLTFLITNGTDIVNLPVELSTVGDSVLFNFLGVPVLITIIVMIIAWYYLRKTRFGKYTYAIGSNAEGTRRSGVNVKYHLFKIYTLSGLLSGLAGMIVVARIATGSPLEGTNDELNAIAAVVIGGASLFGGRGTIFGSTVGALIISVLVSGLVIMGVQPYWQTVTIGIIIILAVYIDQRRYRHRVLK
jgi:ribose transport system permease protein